MYQGLTMFSDSYHFHHIFFVSQQNPLLDAQIATPCGHSFCGFCVETFQATNGGGNITCQMCRQSVVVFCQNRLANNMLAMVEGECVWCHQRFPLNTAKDHVKCCGELETECSRCHAAVKRANRNSHNDECLMADIQCECGVLLKRAEADEHRRKLVRLTRNRVSTQMWRNS